MIIKKSFSPILFGLVTFFLLVSNISICQIQNDLLNNNISRVQLKRYFSQPTTKFHSAIQPYELLDSSITLLDDSIFSKAKLNLQYTKKTNNLNFDISPIIGIKSYDSDQNTLENNYAIAGLKSQIHFKDKIHLRLSIFGGTTLLSSPEDGVLNGIGLIQNKKDPLKVLNYNLALTYTPNDIFAFQIGKGKHKFGDGYRSLILSNDAVNYPYAKIRTRIWNIEYINLFSMQQGLVALPELCEGEDCTGSQAFEYSNKFTASHLLSWKINKDWNVYIFETIIWQDKDLFSQRGFDMNYLNPIIFYRPVEFAVGSSDNAIIGFGGSWMINKKTQIYSQFVIDEMVVKQFIYQTGWWANKYAAQLGVKMFDPFNTKNTYFQLEWNFVRPFTYSHGSVQQNYGHYVQSLAHPAGSNFYEVMGRFIKDWRNFQFSTKVEFLLQGSDIYDLETMELQNLGGNIFQSYIDPFIIRGNIVGQGLTTNTLLTGVQTAYVFDQKNDGRIQLGFDLKYVNQENYNNTYSNTLTPVISGGLVYGFNN